MKIALAQIKSAKGNIEENIKKHKDLISLAVSKGVDAIFFPELSITSYEPTLAEGLSTTKNDKRFDVFQETSDQHNMIIGIGLPLKQEEKQQIGMLVFQAHVPRASYAKQILHADEQPFFVAGDQQIILNRGVLKIAPAICYESLQAQHIEQAMNMGTNCYVASVAKSQRGIDKANQYFPVLAREYNIPVLLCNCIGHCDNFESVGQSAIWNKKGELLAQLNRDHEGLLIYDSVDQTAKAELISYNQ